MPKRNMHALAVSMKLIDPFSWKKLSEGVRRITEGYGSDIVIDAIGGENLERVSRHARASEEV